MNFPGEWKHQPHELREVTSLKGSNSSAVFLSNQVSQRRLIHASFWWKLNLAMQHPWSEWIFEWENHLQRLDPTKHENDWRVILSGNDSQSYGLNANLSWEYSLFQWPFSIAILTYKHSYGKSPCLMINISINDHFPVRYVNLPEGSYFDIITG